MILYQVVDIEKGLNSRYKIKNIITDDNGINSKMELQKVETK